MSFRTDRVRVAILLKRKATLSREEFRRYWIETHGPLVNSLDVFQSEEYQKKIIPDNDVFLDAKGCQLLPLDVLTVVDK
ncbi:hypothetical protein B0H14DRAFT_2664822 [Mycena olivaceomarginata]|nr:hypothetical protein B0H14DRAFT_2664822 [Mycena olivaceomarginata]